MFKHNDSGLFPIEGVGKRVGGSLTRWRQSSVVGKPKARPRPSLNTEPARVSWRRYAGGCCRPRWKPSRVPAPPVPSMRRSGGKGRDGAHVDGERQDVRYAVNPTSDLTGATHGAARQPLSPS